MQTESSVKALHQIDENAIDQIRKLRNDLIKDFLDERYLKEYTASHYNIRDLSPVKIEFIKADLKELLISPVNVNHYRRALEHIRESDSPHSLSENHEELVIKEIDMMLRKYIF